MPVPILKQGNYLIASIQAAMSDADAEQLQDDLMNRVGVFSSPPVLDKSVGTVEATGMFCELRGEGVIGFMVATNDLEKTKASLKSFLANVIRYYVKHWPEHDWEDHV